MRFLTQTFGAIAFSTALFTVDTKLIADVIRVPDVTQGNSGAVAAFGVPPPFTQRFQQVYDATAFGTTPIYITGLIFRPDSGSYYDAAIAEFQLNLSTTTGGVDQLSPLFADNVGIDDTVVFPKGSLHLRSDTPLRLDLSEPFFYDPAAGNLLLDARNYSGTVSLVPLSEVVLDTHNILGDAVSYVRTDDVSSTSAMFSGTWGYVTEFIVTPVPEPTTVSLFGLAAFAAAVSFVHKQFRNTLRRRPHVLK